MKKIIILLLILIFSITTVSATDSNNITVDGDSFEDIQNMIDISDINDTLILNGEYKSNHKTMQISKSMNFVGKNNATLNGNHISGIFNITQDSNLTFTNINFINSKNSAITMHMKDLDYECRSKVIINNCNFINNIGSDDGAIYIYECYVNNSNFVNNHAIGLDDDLNSWGGAILSKYCNVYNSNFINNSALTNGGAILSENGLISKCNFINNTAGWEGGAFEITDVSVVDSNFTNNLAGRLGGGIYVSEGDIINCCFTNNTSNNSGGAISGYRVNIYNTLFENNTALYAGAIHVTNLKIDNTTFKNNHEGAIIATKTTIDFKTSFNTQVALDNSLTPFNIVKVNANNIKTVYNSGKKLKIGFLTSENSRPASYLEFLMIIKKGKTEQYHYADTNVNGLYEYSVSKLSAGKYNIRIVSSYGEESYTAPFMEKTITVTIEKAKTIIKAPKVTNKYKKSKYFKVTVKDKQTKKALKKIKIKLKIYTHKKSKTYTVKTDKNGVAMFKTNKLSKGLHKVIIESGNSNFIISKKSSIKIK